MVDTITGEPAYQLAEENGGKRTLYRGDVIHIKAPSLNGVTGVSPIESCREAIALALIMERHAAQLFGNSARPSGLLSLKERATADALRNILDEAISLLMGA